jgi:CHAD domain-containing protein
VTTGGAVDAPLTRADPARRLLHRRLAEQVAALRRAEGRLSEGAVTEGVHGARIACRRLRSALATYRPLLDRGVVDPLREELRWLGRGLAPARDVDVVHDRLQALARAGSPGPEAEPIHRRLRDAHAAQLAGARGQLAEILGSDRHRRLLAALDGLVLDPPWQPVAARPAAEALPPLVREDWRRLRRRVAGLAGDGSDEALHQVRKDAKRLRYAAEALRPAWGEDAQALARAAERFTDHLGQRQDSLMAAQALRELAADAEAAGEPSGPWRSLLARERETAQALDEDLSTEWELCSRASLRRWLGSP